MKRLALILVLAVVPSVVAQETPDFRSLRCVEIGGTIAVWERLGVVEANPLMYHNTYTFDAIDMRAGHAVFVGNAGTADVLVQPDGGGNVTFTETTPSGNQAFTTVFLSTRERDVFFFVHSRHMDLAGTPVVTQAHGFCAILG